MAQTTRQSNLLVQQDWTKIYQSFTNADFTSYDFETLRSSMLSYLKTNHPETFNDYLESSEYIALIDMIAFLGQSLAFRADLNARENFIDTAQRRDSILKLARMLSYNPQRTTAASGLLKIDSVKTSEILTDSSGINLSNNVIHWNDLTNENWLEQFTTIINASLVANQTIGKPKNSAKINSIQTDEYSVALNTNSLPVAGFNVNVQGTLIPFEAVSATTVGKTYIYQDDPTVPGKFNLLYRNDNNGNGSNNTGFFTYIKQGSLVATQFDILNATPNNSVFVNTPNITNDDQWLYSLDVGGAPSTAWHKVPAVSGINVIYNQSSDKNLYQINSQVSDKVNLVFGDGAFANIPQGSFVFYFRTSNGTSYSISPDDMASVTIALPYISAKNTAETLTVTASLKYSITNASATQTLADIKTNAPQQYYTQNRMITAEDYNIFPQTTFNSIQKIKTTNRSSSGVSMYLDTLDPTGTYSTTNILGEDGEIFSNTIIKSTTFDFSNPNDIYTAVYNDIIPMIDSVEMRNYYYANYNRFGITANVTFDQYETSTNSSSGWLTVANLKQQVGEGVSGNLKYVSAGASLRFTTTSGNVYASVTSTVSNNDITTPSLVNFGSVVPDGATLLGGKATIIPPYKNNLTNTLITTIINQIRAKVTFGLTYDQVNMTWANVPPSVIGVDTSWLLKFSYDQGQYTISNKTLEYVFASAANTKFYFDPHSKAFNSKTGKNIGDVIKVLKINTHCDSTYSLGSDIVWRIYNVKTDNDGYVDDSRVLITFPTTQMEGVPDDPDLYTKISNTHSRNNLYFQYQHNAPGRNRIDPTPVNILDVYILTSDYATNYINYLKDLTGALNTPPVPPTSSSLEIAYSALNDYKAISDTLVYSPARFKPLFGKKAVPELQTTFQVVMNPAISMTSNEIKSQCIVAINKYFDLANWNFGDTFYFSELAAYLHNQLVPNVASVLIVPKNPNTPFGNYFQINSEPWEIITSAATVDDITVVSAITASQLNLGAPLITQR